MLRLLTKAGHLIEEEGVVYLASTDPDPENLLASLQAASSTWRIAQGPRAAQSAQLVGCDVKNGAVVPRGLEFEYYLSPLVDA